MKDYPVLTRIARDVLVVPASTIASESAFSAGKRVLDEQRGRLDPESLKMIICKRDWDRAKNRIQGREYQEDDDEDDPLMIMTSSEDSNVGD